MPGADIAALPGKPGAQIPAQSAALISSPQQAQISSINPAKQSQQLQGSRQGQQVVVVDDRPQQVQVPNIPSSNNGGGQMVMLSPSKETVLNNLIKNHILLDLAYT